MQITNRLFDIRKKGGFIQRPFAEFALIECYCSSTCGSKSKTRMERHLDHNDDKLAKLHNYWRLGRRMERQSKQNWFSVPYTLLKGDPLVLLPFGDVQEAK
jgi:hypothetical protein